MNVDALFLGQKAENTDFFVKTISSLMRKQQKTRQNFYSHDREGIGPGEKRSVDYKKTQAKMRLVLEKVQNELSESSTPWFSRNHYGAHMNSDVLAVAALAEAITTPFNPNNVAYESSIPTSRMESKCIEDLAGMLGYERNSAGGYIAVDGTIANLEALWIARSIKSFPLAVREVKPELVKNRSEWELLNVPVDEVVELLGAAKRAGVLDEAVRYSPRVMGVEHGELGEIFVPSTAHYSLRKAADVLGIGSGNIENIPVDERFRMDIWALKNAIERNMRHRIPILAVVGVVGTTEEGAVDNIAEIAKLRANYQKRGMSFFFHIDAAFGGYARTLFLGESGEFMSYQLAREKLRNDTATKLGYEYLAPEVWEAYRDMKLADSITVDPHKLGYVPYTAGGIILRDKRMLRFVSHNAMYLFEDNADGGLSTNLGSVTLEGTRSGAAVAGVWAAHNMVPLNNTGYGQIIKNSIANTWHFIRDISSLSEFTIAGRKVLCRLLVPNPDLNIVNMAFNYEGNSSLHEMNRFNEMIYRGFSYTGNGYRGTNLILSKTKLEREQYGNSIPKKVIRSLGIPEEEWDRAERKEVFVLRSVIMHPWAPKVDTNGFRAAEEIKKVIGKVIAEDDALHRAKR